MVKIIKPIYDLFRKVDTLKQNKVYFLLLSTILFSFIYLSLGDEHFSGVNKFKQEIREEVVKDAVRKELVENFVNDDNKVPIEFRPLDPELMKTPKEEKIIDNETKKAKKDVIKTDLQTETVQQSSLQSLYNRLYFSIVTGTLLGYGDIYPITNTSKLLSMIQSLCTIALILS